MAHTADWALKVWAHDMPDLFISAVKGMYYLLGIRQSVNPQVKRNIQLQFTEPESGLVLFLNELLYILEQERLAFDDLTIKITDDSLISDLKGSPVTQSSKEIKAVTYHNLKIVSSSKGFEVTIVFDV